MQTITELHLLKSAQTQLKIKLKKKYSTQIEPFIHIIGKIAQANDCNEFEAMNKIQKTLSIYNRPGAKLMFAAALMEIVDQKYFGELPKI